MINDPMEDIPPRVSRKSGPARKKRYAVGVDDGGGDFIECSGKYCRSCTAGMIADCVALCCCPCALLNILAFAFVKIPYMVGRRCLGVGKKKEKMKIKCKKVVEEEVECYDFVVERDNLGNLIIKDRNHCDDDIDSSSDSDSARFEADKIWLDLYQIGHLGFGRVSFTGIDQSLGFGKRAASEGTKNVKHNVEFLDL